MLQHPSRAYSITKTLHPQLVGVSKKPARTGSGPNPANPHPPSVRHRRPSAVGSRHHLFSFAFADSVVLFLAVTGVVRAAAVAQCIPLRRRQRQRHRLQLFIATFSSTISPSLCHHSHHYQPQSSAMSDNVEINSSSAPDLSRNVEDKLIMRLRKFQCQP
ncbi:hypothetical protein WN943_025543 [Citrus x changshan-huyou]